MSKEDAGTLGGGLGDLGGGASGGGGVGAVAGDVGVGGGRAVRDLAPKRPAAKSVAAARRGAAVPASYDALVGMAAAALDGDPGGTYTWGTVGYDWPLKEDAGIAGSGDASSNAQAARADADDVDMRGPERAAAGFIALASKMLDDLPSNVPTARAMRAHDVLDPAPSPSVAHMIDAVISDLAKCEVGPYDEEIRRAQADDTTEGRAHLAELQSAFTSVIVVRAPRRCRRRGVVVGRARTHWVCARWILRACRQSARSLCGTMRSWPSGMASGCVPALPPTSVWSGVRLTSCWLTRAPAVRPLWFAIAAGHRAVCR